MVRNDSKNLGLWNWKDGTENLSGSVSGKGDLVEMVWIQMLMGEVEMTISKGASEQESGHAS